MEAISGQDRLVEPVGKWLVWYGTILVAYKPKTFVQDKKSNTAYQEKFIKSEQVAAVYTAQITLAQEKEWFQSSGLASLLGL